MDKVPPGLRFDAKVNLKYKQKGDEGLTDHPQIPIEGILLEAVSFEVKKGHGVLECHQNQSQLSKNLFVGLEVQTHRQD